MNKKKNPKCQGIDKKCNKLIGIFGTKKVHNLVHLVHFLSIPYQVVKIQYTNIVFIYLFFFCKIGFNLIDNSTKKRI